MDSLETRLRSCPPRRPSARLRRRLFGPPAGRPSKTAWLLGSLAPATACVALTFFSFNRENAVHLLRHEPLTAMILSNQNYAAYASGNFRATQNSLFSVTFDWTNHGDFPSSMASFSLTK